MPSLKLLVFLATALLLAPVSGARAEEAATPSWMKWDADKRQTEIWIKAAYNGNNGSWNFNGYYEGGAIVVVPLETRVLIHFENPDGNYAHSLLVTRPYAEDDLPEKAGRDQVAIPRAYSRSPDQGCLSCKEDIRFKARKAGKFYLFCGVVGHGQAGMWLRFEISETVEAPHVLVTNGALHADDLPPWK